MLKQIAPKGQVCMAQQASKRATIQNKRQLQNIFGKKVIVTKYHANIEHVRIPNQRLYETLRRDTRLQNTMTYNDVTQGYCAKVWRTKITQAEDIQLLRLQLGGGGSIKIQTYTKGEKTGVFILMPTFAYILSIVNAQPMNYLQHLPDYTPENESGLAKSLEEHAQNRNLDS